jgi:hypothetical protein
MNSELTCRAALYVQAADSAEESEVEQAPTCLRLPTGQPGEALGERARTLARGVGSGVHVTRTVDRAFDASQPGHVLRTLAHQEKPTKVALTACMLKLLVIMNTMHKQRSAGHRRLTHNTVANVVVDRQSVALRRTFHSAPLRVSVHQSASGVVHASRLVSRRAPTGSTWAGLRPVHQRAPGLTLHTLHTGNRARGDTFRRANHQRRRLSA